MSAQKSRNRYKTIAKALLLLFAIALIVYGAWGLWQRWQSTHNPNPVIRTEVVTYSTDEPDETPPNCDDSYNVPDNDPRIIEIPYLQKTGCIQPVGIDQNNAVAVPNNIHLAGWYINSVRPGEKGVSLIDGHVRGRYGDAVFTGLEKLEAGEIIRIQFGDMSWKEFEIIEKETHKADKAAEPMLASVNGVENQLTLITCGGRFNAETQTYEDRVIVRAKLR